MPQQPSNAGWTPVDENAAPNGWAPVDEASPRGLFARLKDWAFTPGPLQQNADKPTGALPGSFEGHPENVGEYIPASAGEVAGGARDVAHGDVAKGLHRVISGSGNALLPVAPFVAAAAPVATGAATLFGAAGQQIGKRGAEALGASEDQSDLAGDVVGLGAGYGGGKLGSTVGPYVKPVAGALAKGYAKKVIPDEAFEAYDAVKTARNTPAPPAPETVSTSRTTPGQNAPEVTRPPAPQPATIPPRRGTLALPPAPKGAELAELPATGAKPASQTGEALGKIPVRGSIAKSMKDPGAPLPEKPSPELLKSQPLATGPKPAPPRPSDSLGTIPVRGSIAQSMQEPTPAPIKRGSLKQLLGDQLEEGLGATKLDPKTPLRQQLNTPEATPDMPQGHTPVQSSALRSYKYDPAAKEFHARGTGGDTVYVYGDVSPEAAQAFEQSESKGKAWQAMKQNPLVAKIVNGKRISAKPDVGRGSIAREMK